MFRVEQYNSIFSIYIYILFLLPIIILALFGKKSKLLNTVISIILILFLFGSLSLQMWEFVAFFVVELLLVYFFFLFCNNFFLDISTTIT